MSIPPKKFSFRCLENKIKLSLTLLTTKWEFSTRSPQRPPVTKIEDSDEPSSYAPQHHEGDGPTNQMNMAYMVQIFDSMDHQFGSMRQEFGSMQ